MRRGWWRGGVGGFTRNQIHITNCPLRCAIIRHIPIAICSLPVDSPNDWDWSQIRSLRCCYSMKSHVSPSENEDGGVRRCTLPSLERLYPVAANYKLLELALIISSSMLKHQVHEQYLTKQPRWSSDVIKAYHQEALLLCGMNVPFLLLSIYFSL